MNRGRENKPHIGLYGRCNAGKSTLLNFITGGETALVSPRAGTTADPVRKSYEILGFAPVVFIDTGGVDDGSELGRRRVARTLETLRQIDLALIVFFDWGEPEEMLAALLREENTPFLAVRNIREGVSVRRMPDAGSLPFPVLALDTLRGTEVDRDRLLTAVREALPEKSYAVPSLFEGIAKPGDVVMLICPVDGEAPAGRLILPQVQAIRNLLDANAVAIVVQPEQVPGVLERGIVPRLAVTDSQAFAEVQAMLPEGVELTSFSILLARLKGDPEAYEKGLEAAARLRDGDRVLILENCMHQTSCEDIGRVKIPRWLSGRTGAKLEFTTVSGLAPLPDDLAAYSLAVQCGGCMVTRSQLQNRIRALGRAGVPVTNYGMLIRWLRTGIR